MLHRHRPALAPRSLDVCSTAFRCSSFSSPFRIASLASLQVVARTSSNRLRPASGKRLERRALPLRSLVAFSTPFRALQWGLSPLTSLSPPKTKSDNKVNTASGAQAPCRLNGPRRGQRASYRKWQTRDGVAATAGNSRPCRLNGPQRGRWPEVRRWQNRDGVAAAVGLQELQLSMLQPTFVRAQSGRFSAKASLPGCSV